MATSGQSSFNFTEGMGYTRGVIFKWERVSYSNVEQTSTINWSLTLTASSNYPDNTLHTNLNATVNINEHTYAVEGVSAKRGDVLLSGTETFIHAIGASRTFNYNYHASMEGVKGNNAYESATLDAITVIQPAKITSATDFTDEENPTIHFTNSYGDLIDKLEACISFTGGNDDIPYREISKTGTTYTFNLTDAERQTLIDAFPYEQDEMVVRFYLKTTINGQTYFSYQNAGVRLVNHWPTLSPTVVDVNNRTVELTGNNNTFIRYYSNAYFNTGATALKGAEIEYNTIINGTQTLDDYTSNTGTIYGVESNTFYFTAMDTRGFATRDFLVRTLIPYVRLTSSLTITPLDANGRFTFTVKGKYFNGSFGAKNNSMEVEYMVLDERGDPVFNEEGSGWVLLGTIDPDDLNLDEEGNYEYSYTVSGLNYLSQYELTVNVIDELTPLQTMTTVVPSTPIFDWGKSDFNFNTNINFGLENTNITGNAITLNTNGITSNDNVVFNAGKSIGGINPDGNAIITFEPCNIFGYTVIGEGSYYNREGGTEIYGNEIRFTSDSPIKINGNTLAEYVVEQGSNGTWFYRKWNSGRVELSGYQNISSLACNTALGGWYRTAVQNSPAFPFTVYNPKVTANYESDGYGAMMWFTTRSGSAQPASYYLIRPTSSSSITGVVNFYVTGTWK